VAPSPVNGRPTGATDTDQRAKIINNNNNLDHSGRYIFYAGRLL